MLYDAFKTSSNGEASCSSCHIFGDLDSLAWDLGDPDGNVSTNPMHATPAGLGPNGGAAANEFHPMKGPMTPQTLRGMANSGGLHWRGDRNNGDQGPQIRSFGFLHDGSTDSLFRFFNATAFALSPPIVGFINDAERRDMEQFMLAFLPIALLRARRRRS